MSCWLLKVKKALLKMLIIKQGICVFVGKVLKL